MSRYVLQVLVPVRPLGTDMHMFSTTLVFDTPTPSYRQVLDAIPDFDLPVEWSTHTYGIIFVNGTPLAPFEMDLPITQRSLHGRNGPSA